VVEFSDADTVFNDPKHPYTRALLESIPKIGPTRSRLQPIEGIIPSPFQRPTGCPFHTRCNMKIKGLCDRVVPELITIRPDHEARCLIYDPQYQSAFMTKEANHA
jgi:peptide/nickel transport system ATP-binding protein